MVTESSPPVARLGRIWDWWQLGIVLGLLGFVYYSVVWRLVQQWWNDPNFSHGFFVPLFSGFLVWQQRERLASLRPRPTWFGLVIIVAALLTLIVGSLGAELFLSRISLILLLAGLIIHFLGWGFFRAVAGAWAFLLLMIPIPAVVFNQLTLPLQLLASQLAAALLPILQVPVLREGNVIILPAMPLEVAEACSGIRSLISLGTLAIIYGYFLEESVWRRVLLVVAAVPIAVAANAARIVGTGLLVQYWDPHKALGFFHEFSGWVIFLVSLSMLFLVHRVSAIFRRGKPQEN